MNKLQILFWIPFLGILILYFLGNIIDIKLKKLGDIKLLLGLVLLATIFNIFYYFFTFLYFKVMILEINRTAGPNYGEDLEYVATYLKGKKASDKNPLSYRILFKGVKTGKEYILWIEERRWIQNRIIYFFESLSQGDYKYISPTHIKNKCYNYYHLSTDPKYVHLMLKTWKKSDPLVHIGNFIHQNISNIKNYTWTYRFENKEY